MPVWLVRPLGLDTVRKQASAIEVETTSIFWQRTECKAELYTGSTFVLNPRRSSSFCLRGVSLAGNSAACALGATRRSPLPLSVAYFPGALVTRMST